MANRDLTLAIVLHVERVIEKKIEIHFQTLKTNSDETVAFFPIGQYVHSCSTSNGVCLTIKGTLQNRFFYRKETFL